MPKDTFSFATEGSETNSQRDASVSLITGARGVTAGRQITDEASVKQEGAVSDPPQLHPVAFPGFALYGQQLDHR